MGKNIYVVIQLEEKENTNMKNQEPTEGNSFGQAVLNAKEKGEKTFEFDGEQHFAIINYYGGTTNFEEIKKRDNIKNYFCEKSGITLIRLNKTNIDKIDELLPTSKI
jgi:hypothetical protein